MIHLGQGSQPFAALSQIRHIIAERRRCADPPNARALGPRLANTRVQYRGFDLRVGPDHQNHLCVIDIFDRGHTHIARAIPGRQCSPIGATFNNTALPFNQGFQRKGCLSGNKITDQTANTFAFHRSSGRSQCLGPFRFAQLSVFANVGCVQALAAQTIPDKARLIGNPFFIHAVMVAWQEPHHFAALRVHSNVGPKRVHHINALRLGQFPRTGGKGIRFRNQCTHGTKINNIALHVGIERFAKVARDLSIFTTTGLAHFVNTGHLSGEAYTAGAGNAPRHVGFDQRPQIQILGCSLGLAETRKIDAISHGLILQITLTALIADRAIKRMVDQQELHHTLTGFLNHRGIRFDHRRLAFWARTQITDLHRARRGGLGWTTHDLHKTHPAVAGNRQSFVVTEPRHFDPNLLTRLDQRHCAIHLDFLAINDDLADVAHRFTLPLTGSQFGCPSESLHFRAHNSFVDQKYRPPLP